MCFEVWVYNYVQEMRHQQISPNEVIIRILEKAIGKVPQVGLFQSLHEHDYFVLKDRKSVV